MVECTSIMLLNAIVLFQLDLFIPVLSVHACALVFAPAVGNITCKASFWDPHYSRVCCKHTTRFDTAGQQHLCKPGAMQVSYAICIDTFNTEQCQFLTNFIILNTSSPCLFLLASIVNARYYCQTIDLFFQCSRPLWGAWELFSLGEELE